MAENEEKTHNPNDVSILNYSQEPVVYENVPKVWLSHPTSTEEAPSLVPFTYGEIMDGLSIVPNFAAGDMVVTAPEGKLGKQATIIKPEGLMPENIAEGVSIAGIIGTLIATTGGAKVAAGVVSSNVANIQVTHGLGVVPDVAIFVTSNYNTKNQTAFIFQVSEAFATKYALPYSWIRSVKATSTPSCSFSSNAYFVGSNSYASTFRLATSTTITIVGGSSYGLLSGSVWIVIGGLT